MAVINSFLMIGQSNMAGRGNFGEVPEIDNKLCQMLRMGGWQKMSEPINVDRGVFTEWFSGVSLAASFADEYAKHYNQPVGLIPCADGGTSLADWMPGGILFDNALWHAKLAMRTSKLSGILWHQGENDCMDIKNVDTYIERFTQMITTLKKEIGMPDLPVIIGEISENIDSERWNIPKENTVKFNENLTKIPDCKLVKASDLQLKEDGIHFNSFSLRILGKRYFEAYKDNAKG